MIMLVILLVQVLEVNVYRFEGGDVELWYGLPISVLVDSVNISIPDDSIEANYSYSIFIYNEDGSDSAFVEGKRSVSVGADDFGDFVIDFVPLSLYPGRFHYDLDVRVAKGDYQYRGAIVVNEDPLNLSCSDIVLARYSHGRLVFHGVPILPVLGGQFTSADDMISYLEIYGLVPDSLYCSVEYRIRDGSGAVLIRSKKEVLKYDYAQVDTHAIALAELATGEYTYTIAVNDPASVSTVDWSAPFSIVAPVLAKGREYYQDIHYLLSSDEYRRFLALDEIQKDLYLREFWRKNDYQEFKTRLAEADRMFSAGALQGRDSERGRLYAKIGPPDEVETVSMTYWSRPLEVWHYYGREDYLFCDTKNDHNPRLIKILKPGELTKLLASGVRDGTREEDWMSEIAPGTYDWHENKENPE